MELYWELGERLISWHSWTLVRNLALQYIEFCGLAFENSRQMGAYLATLILRAAFYLASQS